MKKKRKLIIALVHNNNTERLSYIRPKIFQLLQQVQGEIDVDFFETSWQSKKKHLNKYIFLVRQAASWVLRREWTRYRCQKPDFFLSDFWNVMCYTIRKFFFHSQVFKRSREYAAVEMTVSEKHAYAFTYALENKADYLLVLEDDTIFRENVWDKISALLNSLETSRAIPAYVDLAGGFSLDQLGLELLESGRDTEFRYYTKPITNTACAYLVNREQLEIFGFFSGQFPLLRYLAIDWMLNAMFILQAKAHIHSHCRHADPTIFAHGSMTPEYTSWTQC